MADEQLDSEFRNFFPPLSGEQKTSLEQDVLTHGCPSPLILWDNTLIDGYHLAERALMFKPLIAARAREQQGMRIDILSESDKMPAPIPALMCIERGWRSPDIILPTNKEGTRHGRQAIAGDRMD